jgi:hypothetical protein
MGIADCGEHESTKENTAIEGKLCFIALFWEKISENDQYFCLTHFYYFALPDEE